MSCVTRAYSVFHQFRQAKFGYGGSIFKPIFAIDPEAFKNDDCYKSGQNCLGENHLATRI
jgi:hypothetical protein